MNNAVPKIPVPTNEPVRSYAPGSPERASLARELRRQRSSEIDIPAVIGGHRVYTDRSETIHPPHETSHTLARAFLCGETEVKRAVEAALEAGETWARVPWTDRVAVFLKAAALLSGPYRDRLNAATMLGQSKNVHQAEIDSACELIDFFRFNASFAEQLYADQPFSPQGVWNRLEYRPLEGFVFAVTPFNFTSIAGNLPTAPALMGNTVLWKPATTALLSASVIMDLLEAAGLPPGVVNMLPGDGPDVGDPVLASPDLAGLHFTGSTGTFRHLWQRIGERIASYRTYPRIVGETGGKDFIVAHPSADPLAVATAIARGGFEYQGQKCSAASRVYLPDTLWPRIRDEVGAQLSSFKIGGVEAFGNFINAVIDRPAYRKITGYIDRARRASGVEIVAGGTFSDEVGYFVEPTLLRVDDPGYETMVEEIFGPVVSVHVYPERQWRETLDLIDGTSPYALTGAVFARDRAAIRQATDRLMHAAGNFYVNDKPTGAVVGQQPFGGARASGTNDKAGSAFNLTRWVSPRTIKETFVPALDYRYPFLGPPSADDDAEPTRIPEPAPRTAEPAEPDA